MKENNSKVSIIVPVYNAEKAIGRCIESILTQDYENIEVIVIDDGSKDSSYSILSEYAAKDPRLILIHKENSGVSDTRNLGLSKATGDYIQFLDADDYIPTDSTKSMVRAMETHNVDLVISAFYRVTGKILAQKGSIYIDTPLTRNEYAEFMAESPADYYYGVLWNKLYRHSIIQKYNLRMDRELSFCEDTIFNLEYLLHCSTVFPLQIPVYYYVKTEGSLVSQNLNLTKLYEMKTNVFKYYDSFFKEILNEEDYRNERLQISKFLIAPATDDIVLPFLPNTKRLGEELGSVYFEQNSVPNVTTLVYYLNRSYDRYLSTVAAKYSLELNDIKVFDMIRRFDQVQMEKEILEYTGLSFTSLLFSLEKLASRGYLSFKFSSSMELSARVTEESKQISEDIDLAISDLYSICTKGMNTEETEKVSALINTVSENITAFLKSSIHK